MTGHFHVGPCPNCRQGRLFLYRSVKTGIVYGHCEECEWGYLSPDRLAAGDGFLTLLDDDDAEPAGEEDIRRSAWANGGIFTVPE
ncbi:hypothetical protein BA190_31880 [Labrys sp. WJW]|uniref:hypothetical protein n=1 Tax=Labrys sp. WJW TaxID=1737983 RepID=UPI00082D319C|nr:hypothetical protein [Labrys sp. WJW]OCC00908.1 hypothetical protein BA190_31880 [Labrys sp. WJW]